MRFRDLEEHIAVCREIFNSSGIVVLRPSVAYVGSRAGCIYRRLKRLSVGMSHFAEVFQAD